MIRKVVALLFALLLAACGAGQQGGTTEDGRRTTISSDAIPSDQVTLLSNGQSFGARLAAGHLDLVSLTRDWQGSWVAHILTSTRATIGQDSLHLVSHGGNTGEEWNSFVYGTASPGVDHVTLEGFPEARGGKVTNGVWAIALREKEVTPADIHWQFVASDGSMTSGEGIFPPEV